MTTSYIRELLASTSQKQLRRKVLRLVEERWLVERWIVSMVDLERIVKRRSPSL